MFILLTFSYAKTGYQFLHISPSPVQSGLGVSSISRKIDHASAFYYNPATLSINYPENKILFPALSNIEFYFSYMRYIADMNHISTFSVLDIKSINRIGIGFTGLFNNDILNTYYNGDSYTIGEMDSASFYSVLVGYGLPVTKKIGTGLSIKIPVERLGSETSIGLGVDIGGIYQEDFWDASLVVQNLGADLKSIGETYSLPLTIKIAGSYHVPVLIRKSILVHELSFFGEMGKEIEKDFLGALGVQYTFRQILFLRTGCAYYNKDFDLRVGGGIHYMNYQLDYAFNEKDLGFIHRIGFGVKFTSSQKETEEIKIKTLETQEGFLIRLCEKNVLLFEPESAELKHRAYQILDKIIDMLKKRHDKDIYITGHTDNRADTLFNLDLSQKRAKAVYDYLLEKGVSINRMSIEGYGDREPIKDNQTEEGRLMNRRIDILLLHLNREEKRLFDYYCHTGMDFYIHEDYEACIDQWEKAYKIDPANEKLEIWINIAKQQKLLQELKQQQDLEQEEQQESEQQQDQEQEEGQGEQQELKPQQGQEQGG